MPATNQVDERTRRALESFIFTREPRDVTIPPRGLDRDQVVTYLQERLDKPLEPVHAWRVRMVADAYQTKELVGKYDKLLAQPPRSAADFSIAVAFTASKAEVGDTAQRAAANQHYEKALVSHPECGDYFLKLIDCYSALSPESSSDSLKKSIEARKKQLEPRIENDYEARIAHLEYDALLNNDVPAAEDAGGVKARLLKMKDPAQQVREMVKIYLGFEYSGGPYLDPWAVRHLRRAAEQSGKPAVASAFREVLDKADLKKLEAEEREHVRRRALRAIDFFGGAIDEKERKFLDKFRGREDALDELSNE